MKVKYCIPSLFILGALGATPTLAQDIYAGSAAGSYTNDFCPQVEGTLKTAYFEHHCTTSQGTGDNIEKVLANPKSVGIGQFDVVAARMVEAPGKLAIADPKIGLECLYAVTSEQKRQSSEWVVASYAHRASTGEERLYGDLQVSSKSRSRVGSIA